MKRHVWEYAKIPDAHTIERCAQPGCGVQRRPCVRGRGSGPKWEYRRANEVGWATERPGCGDEKRESA